MTPPDLPVRESFARLREGDAGAPKRGARSGPFRWSVATMGLGTLASGLVVGAFPWLWLSTGGSATVAGLVAGGIHGATAIGLLLGASTVARLGPRTTLVVTDLLCAAAVLLAAAAFRPGDPPWLALGLVAIGMLANAPGAVAQDSWVPVLARLARIPLRRANATRDLVFQSCQVLGPVAGVLLVEAAGFRAVLAVAATLLAVVWLLDLWRFPEVHHRTAPPPERHGARAPRLLQLPGLRIVVLLVVIVVAALNAIDDVIGPALAVRHGVGAEGLGGFLLTLGAGGLGSLLAYLAVGYRWNARRLLLGGMALACLGFALVAWPGRWSFYSGAALLGIGLGPLWSIVLSAVQRAVPQTFRTQVIGALGGVILIAQPVASAIVGPLVDAAGPATVMAGIAGVALVATAVAWRHPGLAVLDGRA